MKSLDAQFADIADKWFSQRNLRDGEENLLAEISEESIEKTRTGEAYHSSQRYDNTYEQAYAKRTGKSTSGPVTLRHKKKRIEHQKVRSSGDHSELYMDDSRMGEIAYYQHERGNHGKIRKIWPDRIGQITERALDAAREFFIKRINGY